MEAIWQKLYQPETAFDNPVTVWITAGIAVLLAVVPAIVAVLVRRGRVDEDLRSEVMTRWRSWLVLALLMLGPVLIGPGALMAGVTLLSLLAYRELARATGFFRERAMSAVVVLGILAVGFACFDHWYGFFVALPSLTMAVLAAAALLGDRPQGYIQRVAIGSLSYLLFGVSLGHLGYMANAPGYRALVITIVVCVELNDVFAFVAGKTIGRRKLAPNTSPGKTLGGAVGALFLTTGLFALIGHFVFRGTPLDTPVHLVTLGALISLAGQFGDLVMSSIKRDLGVKDMGASIPGHGGVLDRFDSLLLVPPVAFHYVGYFMGFGLDEPTRIITGP